MEPSTPYNGHRSRGKRKGLKRNLSEMELFGGDDYLNAWDTEIRGMKTPDPTDVDPNLALFANPPVHTLDTNEDDTASKSSIIDEIVAEMDQNCNPVGVTNEPEVASDWPQTLYNTEQARVVEPQGPSAPSRPVLEAVEEDAGRSPSNRRRKKPKPKAGPSRPLSAYNLFFRDYRRCLIRETGGSVAFVTMGKEVGKKWKSLSSKEREEWEKKAEHESARYRAELRMYKEDTKKKRRFGRPPEPEEAPRMVEPSAAASSSMGSRDGFAFRPEVFSLNMGSNVNTNNPVPSFGLTSASYNASAFSLSSNGEARASFHGMVNLAAAGAQNPFPRAREVVDIPEGFSVPEGLPPSGSEIFVPDANGSLKKHKLSWKVYSLASSEAEAFMSQFRQSREGHQHH